MTSEAPVEAGPNARFILFGHPPTPARVELHARTLGWRLRRSLTVLAVALVVAPVVFILPPHVPWALGAIGSGAFIAHRRWKERFTIRKLEGSCPRCGTALGSPGGERLRVPHTLPCPECHHECTLEGAVESTLEATVEGAVAPE